MSKNFNLDKSLQMLAEEQAYETREDDLSRLIKKFAPANDELDLDELEFVAAAGTQEAQQTYEQFLKRMKKDQ